MIQEHMIFQEAKIKFCLLDDFWPEYVALIMKINPINNKCVVVDIAGDT